jgi:signal transduction histidine kinase
MLLLSLPFLFPDGRLPAPWWRFIFRPVMGAWVLFALVFAFARRPLANAFLEIENAPPNPYGILPIDPELITYSLAALSAVSILTGSACLVYRWRGAGREVRQQIKWVVYAFLLLLLILVAGTITGPMLRDWAGINLGLDRIFDLAEAAAFLGLAGALGVAVLKYRLYDIDLVIRRTLVYTGLTAIIMATYVLFVAGIGALFPFSDSSLFLSLVAAGVVAVLFDPLRRWLQRGANRLVFGERDDPYRVLSRLGERLKTASAPEVMLHTIAETVAAALKLPYAAIRLKQGDRWATAAEIGEPVREYLALDLVHLNEVVGKLIIAPRSPGEPFAHNDMRLLEDVAHQAGAVAHAVQLTAALRESRRRLITTREEERRRLRRDLHDGLGPALASQTLRLDTAMDLVHTDPAAAVARLRELNGQTQELVAEIRRLVHELRPPALDDLGLVGGTEAHIRNLLRSETRPRIIVEAPPSGLPPLPAAVELAAFRITMEAVTNVLRHADARECRVRFNAALGRTRTLQIEISDDGRGLPQSVQPGVGLASMRERAEELGGRLVVEAAATIGTRVCAELPIPDEDHL